MVVHNRFCKKSLVDLYRENASFWSCHQHVNFFAHNHFVKSDTRLLKIHANAVEFKLMEGFWPKFTTNRAIDLCVKIEVDKAYIYKFT